MTRSPWSLPSAEKGGVTERETVTLSTCFYGRLELPKKSTTSWRITSQKQIKDTELQEVLDLKLACGRIRTFAILLA